MKTDIKSHTLSQLADRLAAFDQPTYRAAQVTHWLYRRLVTDWDQMTNLPRTLREGLAQIYSLNCLDLVALQESADGTKKFLWRLHDDNLIETVLIPANPALYGHQSDRTTLCLSTQVGCAYRCAFCASGLWGWKRDLTANEIVEQVLAVERWHRTTQTVASANSEIGNDQPGKTGLVSGDADAGCLSDPARPGAIHLTAAETRLVDNLVVMGMGEPLANYDNLLTALEILNAPWGGRIGARRITISTAGLAPQIRHLAEEKFQFRLAVSLHGATDNVRTRLMPVNRKYPLSELISACEYYVARKGKMITLEYLLIAGVNDGNDQLKPLATLARRLGAKINLIPYNPVDCLSWQRPPLGAQRAFHRAVKSLGAPATLRHEKGSDINAACGQLRLNRTSHRLAGQAQPKLQSGEISGSPHI